MVKILQDIRQSFEDEDKRRTYFIVYTILFFTFAFFIFSWYIFLGNSLIWQGDGFPQHFNALVYYAKYLRQIVSNLLLNHRLVIPEWDFYIGEGSDIINTLHYYVIGDPITLFSVFVPTRYMHLFYSFSCILRLYLAGIAFSALSFGTGVKNRYGIMAGALSYCFCSWALINATRHPFFLNPMIYFPLIILGTEKIIRRQRPYVFILSVAVSAASNFYFFYMIVLLTVIYTLIRLGFLYRKDFKNGILTLLRISVTAVVGVCMAGVILFPVLMMFLQDSRMTSSQPLRLFYPLHYYSQLPSVVITNSNPYWLCMGFSAPVVTALFILLIRRKENRFLRVLLGVCTIIILFPVFGWALNGMSYIANRWSWALALLCSYILVIEWNALFYLSHSDWKKVFVCCIAFYIVCLLFDRSGTASTFSAVPLFFIVLFTVMNNSFNREKMWKRQVLLILIVGVGAVNLSYWIFAPGGGNYVFQFVENKKVQEELGFSEAKILKDYADVSYPRYTGKSVTYNANMLYQVSSTQYYWSISNPYINNFRSDLEMREPIFFNYEGYDDRSSLVTLSAVRYYVTKYNKDTIPYGFTEFIPGTNVMADLQQAHLNALRQELGTDELTDVQSDRITASLTRKYSVYKNEYALPLGYCYQSYVRQATWESLDAVQKQELQLEAAYVDNPPPDKISEYTGDVLDYSIPFEIECSGDDIIETESGFLTTAGGQKAVLSFEGKGDCETYICFEGLEFKATPEYDLYSDDETVDPLNLYNKANWDLLSREQQISIRKAKLFWDDVSEINLILTSSANISKTLNYLSPNAAFSGGRHNFIVNLGYREEPVTSITITLPSRGIYTIENLRVYNVPMDRYAERISALQENTLQNITLDTNVIRGEINVDSPQLLCMAVPYSAGWKAYVDGEETPVMLTNERYPGILVPIGSHEIEFCYSMPYKHMGIALSLVGMTALIAVAVPAEKKYRNKEAVH